MANATAIERSAYDPEEDLVKADLIAENGGRAAHIQLRFPFGHHEDRPTTDLRAIALTEIRQILLSAADLMLPDIMNAGNGTVMEAGRSSSLEPMRGRMRAAIRQLIGTKLSGSELEPTAVVYVFDHGSAL